MDPGDTTGLQDAVTAEELRHVEGQVHLLSSDVRRIDGDLASLTTDVRSLRALVDDVGGEVRALRAEERERADEQRADRRWVQALIRDGGAGVYSLTELACTRATDAAVLTRVAVIVALFVAALYGVTLAYDGEGWTIGTGTAAEMGDENRALPDVRESDQVPERYPVEPAAPQPTM